MFVGNQVRDLLRWCEDIGMFATDRPINDIPGTGVEGSCVHATDFCKGSCYNVKLYTMYPNMVERDVRLENEWRGVSGAAVAKALERKRKQTKRARFMTRGEAFKDYADVERVRRILDATPETLWWCPTRAWRNPLLRIMVEQLAREFSNFVPLASMDPTNTPEEWNDLKASGWSTMFFGDDDMRETPNGDRMFLCPKTHKGMKGHCSVCKAGCFAKATLGRRVDVHLSSH